MDEKIIIYIIIGIIYYGYQLYKKAKNRASENQEQAPPKPQPRQSIPKPEPAPVKKEWSSTWPSEPAPQNPIFELLEQMKQEEKKAKRIFVEPAYTDSRSLEVDDYETQPEKAVVASVNPYIEYRSIDVESYGDDSSKFKEFVIEPRPEHPIRKVLKDPKRMKEAFVISEILTKKY